MAVKHSEKADLGPLYIKLLLALGLQNIKDNANPVLVVLPNDALIGVGRIGLYHSALLLTGLGWFVVLQLDGLGVQHWWVFSKEQGLHLHELDVFVSLLT